MKSTFNDLEQLLHKVRRIPKFYEIQNHILLDCGLEIIVQKLQ